MDCDDGLIGCLDDELDRVAAILGDHGVALRPARFSGRPVVSPFRGTSGILSRPTLSPWER